MPTRIPLLLGRLQFLGGWPSQQLKWISRPIPFFSLDSAILRTGAQSSLSQCAWKMLIVLTCFFGHGDIGGTVNGPPWYLRHILHFLKMFLISTLPRTIQYFVLIWDSVWLTPVCSNLLWYSSIISSTNFYFRGRKIGHSPLTSDDPIFVQFGIQPILCGDFVELRLPIFSVNKGFFCKAFIHCFHDTFIPSDVGTSLGFGIFLSFLTKWFTYAVTLKSLLDDEYLFSFIPNGVIFSICCDSWRYRKSILASYYVVGPLTSDWIFSIVSWLIFSTFHVGQEDKSSFNHSGPFHQKVHCFNSCYSFLC